MPQQYRAPFFLCFIESRTRDQAARRAGLVVANASSKTRAARKLLHVRLTRRGLTLSVALAALGLFQQGTKAAGAVLTGHDNYQDRPALDGGQVSHCRGFNCDGGCVADRVLRSMAVIKLKAMATLVVTACLIASGAGFMLRREGESLRAPACPSLR